MKGLNIKQIPIKLFVKESSITLALHWRWSITWRWIVKWKKGRFKWGKRKFSNSENGHGWRHYCMGRFGMIAVTWQPNMKRNCK